MATIDYTMAGNWQPKRDIRNNKGAWASIFTIVTFIGWIIYDKV